MDQFTSFSHLLALGATVLLVAILVPPARRRPGTWVTAVAWGLAAALVVNEVAYQLVQVHRGTWSVTYSLPLFVCDVGAFVAALALVWRRRILVEITWFWALAGTLQGMLTPDHVIAFPSYDWVEYYGDHIGVILAACLLVVGLRLHPRPGAVARVTGITLAYIVLVGMADLVTGGNYDYLRVPSPGSLLTVVGPWPWYILSAAGVGVCCFVVLDLPFWPERRRLRRRVAAASAAGPGG
jgi:hypothetical integral membrane protein (TIGR02206 family)